MSKHLNKVTPLFMILLAPCDKLQPTCKTLKKGLLSACRRIEKKREYKESSISESCEEQKIFVLLPGAQQWLP